MTYLIDEKRLEVYKREYGGDEWVFDLIYSYAVALKVVRAAQAIKDEFKTSGGSSPLHKKLFESLSPFSQPRSDAGTYWLCVTCGYQNSGPICTKCGKLHQGEKESK